MSSAELDGGLKRYFRAPKYVFCGSRIQVPIENFLRETSFEDVGTAVTFVVKSIDGRADFGEQKNGCGRLVFL